VETLGNTIRREVAACHVEVVSDRPINAPLMRDWRSGVRVLTDALTACFERAVEIALAERNGDGEG
jgi:hypothetical protein